MCQLTVGVGFTTVPRGTSVSVDWTGITLNLGCDLLCNTWSSTTEEVELCDSILKRGKIDVFIQERSSKQENV